jgi:hypothetical protein
LHRSFAGNGVIQGFQSFGSIDVDEGAAIDRKRNAGNKICLVGSEKQGGVRDIPA